MKESTCATWLTKDGLRFVILPNPSGTGWLFAEIRGEANSAWEAIEKAEGGFGEH